MFYIDSLHWDEKSVDDFIDDRRNVIIDDAKLVDLKWISNEKKMLALLLMVEVEISTDCDGVCEDFLMDNELLLIQVVAHDGWEGVGRSVILAIISD